MKTSIYIAQIIDFYISKTHLKINNKTDRAAACVRSKDGLLCVIINESQIDESDVAYDAAARCFWETLGVNDAK